MTTSQNKIETFAPKSDGSYPSTHARSLAGVSNSLASTLLYVELTPEFVRSPAIPKRSMHCCQDRICIRISAARSSSSTGLFQRQ